MRVIVNDASVLIDIHKAGILQVYSRAIFTLVLPDVVHKELRDMSDVNFEELGFEMASLEVSVVLDVLELFSKDPAVWLPVKLLSAYRRKYIEIGGN